MKMLIKEFALHRLNNGRHYMFVSHVLEKADENNAVCARAGACVEALHRALEGEEKVFKVSQKSIYTDRIARADACRGRLYRSFRSALPGFLLVEDENMVEAAKTLRQVVKDFSINPKDSLPAEGGMLTVFLEKLEKQCREQVETLGLTVLVDQLRLANQTVGDLMMVRADERKNIVPGAMASARKVTDKAYAGLVGMVNGLVYVEGGEPFADFVRFVNQLILECRREKK